MNVFAFPLRYLRLRDEDDRRLFLRDALGVIILAIIISTPFWFAGASYFGPGGFLDRFGSFAGVLTGFYVAALVGVATFATNSSAMNTVITVGPIRLFQKGEEPEELTRRQYVCYLFGYLAFVSLCVSLAAILLVVASGPIRSSIAAWLGSNWAFWAGAAMVFIANIVLAHMVATTCQGLYYLIERLYAEAPVLLDKDGNPVSKDGTHPG